ncbi:MAG: thioredoxin family protein [Shewanella sp.]
MKNIKVLGSGCTKCTKTAEIIAAIAQEKGIEIALIKETNLEAIMNYQVMSTPAVVIDEKVVHWGSIPTRQLIETWLAG